MSIPRRSNKPRIALATDGGVCVSGPPPTVIIEFNHVNVMTQQQRIRIARWLQQKAQDLEDYGNLWNATHRAFYPDTGKGD